MGKKLGCVELIRSTGRLRPNLRIFPARRLRIRIAYPAGRARDGQGFAAARTKGSCRRLSQALRRMSALRPL